MAKTRTFSDLDLSFTRHPVTQDISVKYDAAAIKASVKNLVRTSYYERLFHSEIGSMVPGMLFELAGPGLAFRLKKSIEDVINNFEPRVVLLNTKVSFSPDDHYIYVEVTFRIVNTDAQLTVEVPLERTR